MRESSDLIGILLSLAFQFSLAVASFIGFSILRPINLLVYEPRVVYAKQKPKQLAPSFLAWIKPVINLNELQSMNEIGLDAIMFLRFVSVGFKFFSMITLGSIPLIFIHIYAQNIADLDFVDLDEKELANPSLSLLSITNVPKGSPLFYIHAILAYLYSFWAYYLLNRTWNEYVLLRRNYFDTQEYADAAHNKTLLFTYLPPSLSTPENILKYLEPLSIENTPTQIFHGRNYLEIPQWIKKHRQLTVEFEKELNDYFSTNVVKPGDNISIYKRRFIPFCGPKVELIYYYKSKLMELERKIYQARARNDTTFKPDASCFVTFEDIYSAHVAAKQIHEGSSFKSWYGEQMHVDLSPHFDDIIWDNIGLTKMEKEARKIIGFFAITGLVILWLIFSTLIGLLSQLTLLRNVNEYFAAAVFHSPVLIIFIQSFLTPGIMALVNLFLPFLLRKVSTLEGTISGAIMERSAMVKFFQLQVVLVLIHICTSIFDSLLVSLGNGRVVDTFNTFIRQLMNQFVTVGTFYINYIVTGYTFFGLEIIQGGSLFFSLWRRYFKNQTPREVYKNRKAPTADYVSLYGFLTLTFLLGICYSLIAPLIVPFTTGSFGIAYLTMKYQFIYVYDSRIETGGAFWPKMFNLLCFSILMFQLLTFGAIFVVGFQSIGLLGFNYSTIPKILLFLLPFLTILFWMYMKRKIGTTADYFDAGKYARLHQRPENLDSKHVKEYDRIFNPCVSKPLQKIWVQPKFVSILESIYQPEFENVVDFVRKTYPSISTFIETQQSQRTKRIKSIIRKEIKSHRSQSLSDVVFLAKEANVDLDQINEFPIVDPTLISQKDHNV